MGRDELLLDMIVDALDLVDRVLHQLCGELLLPSIDQFVGKVVQVSGEFFVLDIDYILEELQLVRFLEPALLRTNLVSNLLLDVVPLLLHGAIAVLVLRQVLELLAKIEDLLVACLEVLGPDFSFATALPQFHEFFILVGIVGLLGLGL